MRRRRRPLLKKQHFPTSPVEMPRVDYGQRCFGNDERYKVDAEPFQEHSPATSLLVADTDSDSTVMPTTCWRVEGARKLLTDSEV